MINRGDSRHWGPAGATLRCPACGCGWFGSEAEVEKALIAEVWWDARQVQGEAMSDAEFLARERADG